MAEPIRDKPGPVSVYSKESTRPSQSHRDFNTARFNQLDPPQKQGEGYKTIRKDTPRPAYEMKGPLGTTVRKDVTEEQARLSAERRARLEKANQAINAKAKQGKTNDNQRDQGIGGRER